MRKYLTESPKGKDGQASGEFACLRLQSHQFIESARYPFLSSPNTLFSLKCLSKVSTKTTNIKSSFHRWQHLFSPAQTKSCTRKIKFALFAHHGNCHERSLVANKANKKKGVHQRAVNNQSITVQVAVTVLSASLQNANPVSVDRCHPCVCVCYPGM